MDFWFAIYISFCQLLILLLSFTQFQRCLNVPGCIKRHFATSFFGRLPEGNLYSQKHHDSVNISFKLSLEHLHSNQYFAANWNRRIVHLHFFNTCTLYRCSDFSNNGHTLYEQKATEAGHMWSTFPYYTALAKHLLCVNLSEEKVELGRISTNITKRRSYNGKRNTGDL